MISCSVVPLVGGWYSVVRCFNHYHIFFSNVRYTGNRIGLRDTTLDNAAGKYREGDSCWTPVVDPYSGQTQYIRYGSLRPIRD